MTTSRKKWFELIYSISFTEYQKYGIDNLSINKPYFSKVIHICYKVLQFYRESKVYHANDIIYFLSPPLLLFLRFTVSLFRSAHSSIIFFLDWLTSGSLNYSLSNNYTASIMWIKSISGLHMYHSFIIPAKNWNYLGHLLFHILKDSTQLCTYMPQLFCLANHQNFSLTTNRVQS